MTLCDLRDVAHAKPMHDVCVDDSPLLHCVSKVGVRQELLPLTDCRKVKLSPWLSVKSNWLSVLFGNPGSTLSSNKLFLRLVSHAGHVSTVGTGGKWIIRSKTIKSDDKIDGNGLHYSPIVLLYFRATARPE
jgi:hypothetical protein